MGKVTDLGSAGPDDPIYKEGLQIYGKPSLPPKIKKAGRILQGIVLENYTGTKSNYRKAKLPLLGQVFIGDTPKIERYEITDLDTGEMGYGYSMSDVLDQIFYISGLGHNWQIGEVPADKETS